MDLIKNAKNHIEKFNDRNLTKEEENYSTFNSLFISLGITFFLTIVLLLVLSLLFAFTNVSEEFIIALTSFWVSTMSCFVGGWILVRKTRNMGLFNGIILGIAYTLIQYLFGCIVNFEICITTRLFATLLLNTIGGAMGGVLSINLVKSKNRVISRLNRS